MQYMVYVLLARYISALIILRYGTLGPRSFSLSSRGKNISSSYLVKKFALECSMDVIYSYKIFLKKFMYKLTGE